MHIVGLSMVRTMSSSDKRKVKEEYDALGGRVYDLRYGEEQMAKYRLILKHLDPSPPKVVLDDGCGTGLLMERLETCCVGLDLSESLLEAARSRLGASPLLHMVQGDSETLPFRGQTFDIIFAVTLIQNTPKPGEALKEMRRVGKRGSEIVITTLKKAFDVGEFRHLVYNEGLKISKFLDEKEVNDWIAFVDA